jgi:hypothetical protein
MIKKQNVIITKESRGTFLTDIDGYKLIEKDGLKEYVITKVPANSNYKVINFNTNTKRLFIFSNVKGRASEVLEVNYESILDNSIIDNSNVSSPIEGMIISDRVKYIFNKEAIKTFIIYLVAIICSYLLGRI